MVSRHARRFVLLPASRLSFHHPFSQTSKSHQIISFADPHPLTLLESYRFKNMAVRGPSPRSLAQNVPLLLSPFLTPLFLYPLPPPPSRPLPPTLYYLPLNL